MSTPDHKRSMLINAEVGGAYQLLSVENAPAPPNCEGTDWFRYRIALGSNVIVGYRQGSPSAVRGDVAEVVQVLNDRRMVDRHGAQRRR